MVQQCFLTALVLTTISAGWTKAADPDYSVRPIECARLANDTIRRADIPTLKILVTSSLAGTDRAEQSLLVAILAVETANRGPVRRTIETWIARSAFDIGMRASILGHFTIGLAQIRVEHAMRVSRHDFLDAIQILETPEGSILIAQTLLQEIQKALFIEALDETSVGRIATAYNSGRQGPDLSVYGCVVSRLWLQLQREAGVEPGP